MRLTFRVSNSPPMPLHTRGALRRRMPHALCLAIALLVPASAAACPMTPPPVRDLALDRYYTDTAGSVTDPALLAEQRRASAPVRSYLNGIVKEADAALRQASPSLAKYHALCALEGLEIWAEGGALLGTIDGKQAEAERRWTLAGAALAFLKIKVHATPEQRTVIEPWLVHLADAALAAFDGPGIKHNNHWYWLGLGLGATGLAADSAKHWDLSRGIMQDATRDVAADGSLAMELARGARALHYHAFAAMPLVTLAELARFRGEDWESFGDGALRRFVDLTARAIADPALFDDLAGTPQERPVNPSAGWLPLYAAAHRDWTPPPGIEIASGHRWLGGNVGLLRAALAAKRSHAGN